MRRVYFILEIPNTLRPSIRHSIIVPDNPRRRRHIGLSSNKQQGESGIFRLGFGVTAPNIGKEVGEEKCKK
jgi:hypothetical protein